MEPTKKTSTLTQQPQDAGEKVIPYKPVEILTKDTPNLPIPKNTCDEKLSRYEYLVWENRERMFEVQDHLTTRRDDVAEKLVNHAQATVTPKWTKEYIRSVNAEEDKAKHDYYAMRKEMKTNFRNWRIRYMALLNHPEESVNLRAHVKNNPEFSKFINGVSTQVGHITDSGWDEQMIKKEVIDSIPKTKIGEGSFGRVFRGIVHGTAVAIKELKSTGAVQRKTFANEIIIFKNLKHDNILKFMGACLPVADDAGDKAPYYAFLSELAENGSLYDVLYSKKAVPVKFSFSKKMTIISEIVDGMNYLHTRPEPIYHFDLKSANILLNSNYSVRIADFGLARILDYKSFISGANSYIGGTPLYMAPEILDGSVDQQNLTLLPKADVYSFAILVNELLDEKKPYSKVLSPKSTFEQLKTKVVLAGETPGKHRPDLANEIAPLPDMIKNCWKKNPADRPTFEQLKEAKHWEKAKVTAHGTDLGKILEIFKDADTESQPFTTLLKRCSDVWEEPLRLFFDPKDGKFDTEYLRTLLAVFGISKGTDRVSFKSVQRTIKWLQGVRACECLDNLYRLYTKDYFFGIMEQEKSEEIFGSSQRVPNSYLVRWSETKESFFLDYLPKEKDKSADKAVIESVDLKVNIIKDLENRLQEVLGSRNLKKGKVAGNRPAQLETLKIKEKWLASDSKYGRVGGDDSATGFTADTFRGNLSHYDFIID